MPIPHHPLQAEFVVTGSPGSDPCIRASVPTHLAAAAALQTVRSHGRLYTTARQSGSTDQAYLTNETRRLANATPAQLTTSLLVISANGCI
ncbi:MAG: hypothetical protein LC797_13530 [Chloroflexi bacterium]|nr:hypothetical protein [Chloroflexota bacterium]